MNNDEITVNKHELSIDLLTMYKKGIEDGLSYNVLQLVNKNLIDLDAIVNDIESVTIQSTDVTSIIKKYFAEYIYQD